MTKYNDKKTVCNKCYRSTWYETEQPCHCQYEDKKTCDKCGHTEIIKPIKMIPCGGTLKVIDYSELDKNNLLISAYENHSRLKITYKDGTNERMYIGKSTGWKPCWLIIKRNDSIGGGSLIQELIERIEFV